MQATVVKIKIKIKIKKRKIEAIKGESGWRAGLQYIALF